MVLGKLGSDFSALACVVSNKFESGDEVARKIPMGTGADMVQKQLSMEDRVTAETWYQIWLVEQYEFR